MKRLNSFKKYWRTLCALAIGSAMIAGMGCGDDPVGSGTTAVTISGALSTTTSIMSSSTNEISPYTPRAVTDYSVRCVTLSGTPKAGEGTCNSSGAFSFSIEGADGKPLGCFILKDAAIVAVVSFQTAAEGMGGSAAKSGSYQTGNGTSGLTIPIVFNTTTGVATVDVSQIVETGKTSDIAGTWTDPTGAWVLSDAGAEPTGYEGTCAPGASNCHGPTEGESIYLHQYTATDAAGATKYGLAIWESASSRTTCFGSSGGEGAELPSGWTAGSADLTAAMNGVSTSFGNPASVNVPSQGVCGVSSGTCASISAGAWGLSEGECELYCTMMSSLWSQGGGGCSGRGSVSWSDFHTALNASNASWNGTSWTNLTANTSNSDYVSYLNGSVKLGKKPKPRYMFNQISITGAVGSLVDEEYDLRSACESYSNGQCTGSSVNCYMNSTNTLTFTQTSASTAVVSLIRNSTLSEASHAACATDPYIEGDLGEAKFYFAATKQ